MTRLPDPSPTDPMGPDPSLQDPIRWAARLRNQLLTEPSASDPATLVRHLLAVQAQDGRAMRLAIRSRTTNLVATDVDRALTDERSIVVTWLNRGTLHLVAAEDYWWLHDLTAPRRLTWNRTRLTQEGVTPAQAERGVELVVAAVAGGPRTRNDLRAHLTDAGLPTAGQALVHVLIAASLEGEVVRGPVIDGELAYASVTAWLGPRPSPLDPDDALARLAMRYLAAHAPAAASDLATWAGITLTQARAGLAAVVADTPAVPITAGDPTRGADLADERSWPAPRLLGGFDPVLHGWTDRTFVTGAHRSIVTTNGIFRPIALVNGRAVATWRLADRRLTINPLEPIDPEVRAALDVDADAVRAFLGIDAS